MSTNTAEFLDYFVGVIAERVAEKLGRTAQQPERIPVAEATQHGAPSAKWLQDQARLQRITLRGPRGGRYVLRAELEALLAGSTIRRKRRERPAQLPVDERAAVAELGARRGCV